LPETPLLTCDQCREADRIAIEIFGIPGLVLMENAGRSCAEKLLWHSPQAIQNQQAVVVLCGGGNNGGDGFVIARHLYNAGLKVKVVLFRPPEEYSGDAETNLRALALLKVSVVEFDDQWSAEKVQSVFSKVGRADTDWVVDAILGTGATGELRPNIAAACNAVNAIGKRVLAVDLPTGLNGDTGEVSPCTIKADLTCTFIDRKCGFASAAAEAVLGFVYVVEIGLPVEILDIVDP
jgi:NAD(P)H-hydrate epimerase